MSEKPEMEWITNGPYNHDLAKKLAGQMSSEAILSTKHHDPSPKIENTRDMFYTGKKPYFSFMPVIDSIVNGDKPKTSDGYIITDGAYDLERVQDAITRVVDNIYPNDVTVDNLHERWVKALENSKMAHGVRWLMKKSLAKMFESDPEHISKVVINEAWLHRSDIFNGIGTGQIQKSPGLYIGRTWALRKKVVAREVKAIFG